MLQHDEGDDFVLATNETHTVREFVEEAFARADLDWKEYVKHDDRYERPAEVDLLIGDPAKAKKVLGWEPKVRFKELVQIMVDADLHALATSARSTSASCRNLNCAADRRSSPARDLALARAPAPTLSSGSFTIVTRARGPTIVELDDVSRAHPDAAVAGGRADAPLLGRSMDVDVAAVGVRVLALPGHAARECGSRSDRGPARPAQGFRRSASGL